MEKLVLLLSSKHSQPIVSEVNGKPEIIEFYNITKGSVDTFDQMCSAYSCSRRTRRWPLYIFYGMVNACSISSWIIHTENMKRNKSKSLTIYMKELALQLIAS